MSHLFEFYSQRANTIYKEYQDHMVSLSTFKTNANTLSVNFSTIKDSPVDIPSDAVYANNVLDIIQIANNS
jgi:hypothetical protein